MKKNKTERHIFEAADRLTPEPPAFSEIEKKVDWQEVALKARASKRERRWILPISIFAAVCSLAAAIIAVVCLFPRGPEYYGGGGERPIVFGGFVAQSWHCSDPSIDLSAVSLTVSPNRADPAKGIACLFGEDGSFACSVSFAGEPFSSFEYDSLQLTIGRYCGIATLLDARFDFAMTFSSSESKAQTIDITFGVPSSSPYYGNVVLRRAE